MIQNNNNFILAILTPSPALKASCSMAKSAVLTEYLYLPADRLSTPSPPGPWPVLAVLFCY